jgi:hypothetical protein
MKGMLVHVLRSSYGDCTNNGISSGYDQFVLVGPGVPEIFEPSDKIPALLLEDRGRWGYRAVPMYDRRATDKGYVGPMMGGNFVHTSDSRMPTPHPIPVHDRYETVEHYNSMD